MPGEPPDSQKLLQSSSPQDDGGLSELFTRISLKAGLAIFFPVGLILFFLSRFNYLLVHTLIEFFSIVLLTAVFLIGWNTRHLVQSQFFVVLAVGFLLTGCADLLHMLTYKGMNILPVASANTATQLWVIARTINVFAFFFASLVLGKKEVLSAKTWFLLFLSGSLGLMALVWPFRIFPDCFIEGQGLTAFKVTAEYVIIGMLALSAAVLYAKKHYLNHQVSTWLLLSIALSVLSELMFTLYVDVYGFSNFLGHYIKLGSVFLVYLALIEGTLRSPFATLFRDMGQSYEELNQELKKRVAAEKQRETVNRETAILYQMSRVMHSTLNLDELAHLILSLATSSVAGGFERATLFMANQRTGTLQGMLGVSQDDAALVMPKASETLDWNNFHVDHNALEAQRRTEYNQKVVKQRLLLDEHDNALAKAYFHKKVIMVMNPGNDPESGCRLHQDLELGPYACAPLVGRDQLMGVLLVDNNVTHVGISRQRKRFLELFANLAGTALENVSLIKRLEMAHDNLRDIQEQLIHGEKMAVLGEMAAQVAHELRNPLVSIGGFAQRLVRTEPENLRAKEYAEIIAREVLRMEELLDNILSFSKRQVLCFERCDVGDILQEIIDLEYELCLKQGIEIFTDFSPDLPHIVADCRQLQQVFLNLMINARQVIGSDGVITIRAYTDMFRGERSLVVDIEDTGGGIAPEHIRHIFNPFFSTSSHGTGLGLSISQRIVAHHHGRIEVMNVKHGARFSISLPLLQYGPQPKHVSA